jgi:competence protein ComEA
MSRSDRILVAAGGAAVVLAAVAVVILLAPAPAAAPTTDPAAVGLLVGTPPAEAPATSSQSQLSGGTIFVDVEGAVAEPGIRELPAGSRVADAIAAAGGYASDADLEAAATALNLAQPVSDGEQVQVPRVGEVQPALGSAEAAVAGEAASTGLVNLNTATPEELEALPGIGPVTVQRIVAARQERPFASLDEAQERGVLDRGQLEQIRDLATAG